MNKETDAERLDLIKESGICLAIEDLATKKPWPDPIVDEITKDVIWLIEQAERVPELEKDKERLQALNGNNLSAMYSFYDENERFRKALKSISQATNFPLDEVDIIEEFMKIARQALEVECRD